MSVSESGEGVAIVDDGVLQPVRQDGQASSAFGHVRLVDARSNDPKAELRGALPFESVGRHEHRSQQRTFQHASSDY